MKENKKDKVNFFPEETYQNLSVNDLILYAIYSLEAKNIEKTFPNIVVESFTLFPKKFNLQGYPQYPDSEIADRPLRKMSETSNPKRYIEGGRGTEYKITDVGWERLNKLKDIFELGKKDRDIMNKKIEERRYKMRKVINLTEKHLLFDQYLKNGENIDIPESLLRDLLFATMETSHEKLREKMNILLEYCKTLGKNDLEKFLIFCRNKHREIFYPKNK